MRLLEAHNTETYLRELGHLAAEETVVVTELSGGVSNIVLRVERGRGDVFILKQAREKLRVAQEWRCDVSRIFREMDTLRISQLLLADSDSLLDEMVIELPEILWEDRANYAFAMTSAPLNARTWKDQLLTHEVHSEVAIACGRLLGRLHRYGWKNAIVQQTLSDTTFFQELRVNPYYRRIAEVHPELEAEIELLIGTLPNHAFTLVHGDFSPKNVLIGGSELMLVDFEVGHYGDPAFDTGFFLSHLILKAIWAAELRGDYTPLVEQFWHAYRETLSPVLDTAAWMSLEERTIMNLAGCLLARVDGKSPVNYLSAQQQDVVRQLASVLFRSPPETVAEVCRQVE
jgi:tRNA A-37 threonylcarbamoyl transferase component Bud32